LLAAGDPPDEIYKTFGSATNDELIDKKYMKILKMDLILQKSWAIYHIIVKRTKNYLTIFIFK
jgi:hypothetical protein